MIKRILALAAACMLLAAGCSAPPTPSASVSNSPSTAAPQPESTPPIAPQPELTQEVDRDLTYSVSVSDYGGEPLRFDADGNLLAEDGSEDIVILRDLVTREPRYRMHTLVEDTGEDNEYGSPIVRRTTALWDLDGNLLYDYGGYTYSSAFGDLLIRQEQRDGFWVDASMIPENFFTELWNVKTGKTVQHNVASLDALDDSGSLFLATNIYGHPLGTVDNNGSVVKGFDESVSDFFYSQVYGDMIITHNRPYEYQYSAEQGDETKPYYGPEKDILLTSELDPVASYDYLSGIDSLDGNSYLRYVDGGSMGLMDMQGNKLFTLPSPKHDYIDYCDGELLIMSLNTRRNVLMDMQGNAITPEFDQIEPIGINRWNPEVKPERFVARLGTTVSILDRQGQVVAIRDIPNLSNIQSVGKDYISYLLEQSAYDGLLDMELKVVLEPDKYDTLYNLRLEHKDDNSTPSPMIVGSYYHGKRKDGQVDYNMRRYDILDSKLVPIITGITSYGTVGQGRIAVVRGFSAGVIDWQGNWIGKTTIFQTASDELETEMY